MIDFQTRRVFDEWDVDLNREMRRLVKNGESPWRAVVIPSKNVSNKRK